ncbi:alpha/beta hydrolase [Nonomuraea turkmeniaca]|uniref:Alpha/beta hydrolase n=1 Tax=Nonomuraea turkmeniaca TaxID=103838 RepID=A0A5S4GDX8_9ACTN|nr:alpha/beta hydrolase [Nonomuraea turkmeniaca]TMR24280.1 alpha/beta hydrolase [Nonomuraea turkmeniaca]
MKATTGITRSADGTEIAFTSIGSGPAIVIINGAMSYRGSHPTEGTVAQGLAARHTVITYDRRGRGESGPTDPALAATEAVQAEVADVAALIDHAGGTAAVLGFSSGGVLALEAVRAGLPITALVLWEPPFLVSADRAPLAAGYRERVQQALADGRPGDAVALFLTEPCAVPAEFVEPMRAEPYWAGMEQIAPSLPNDAAIMGDTMSGDPARLQRYATVDVPMLVTYGDAGLPGFAHAATALAGVLPNATARELPGKDHDVSPEHLVSALTEWLPTAQH